MKDSRGAYIRPIKNKAWENIYKSERYPSAILAGLAMSVVASAAIYHLVLRWNWMGLVGIVLLQVLLLGPLEVGATRYFYQRITNPKTDVVNCLLYPFNKTHYASIVAGMGLRYLVVTGWTLVLVIPGIVATYTYAAVPYLLAVNPSIGPREVLQISRKEMDGNREDFFVLDLSLLGWHILDRLTLGILGIVLMPYISCVQVHYMKGLPLENTLEAMGSLQPTPPMDPPRRKVLALVLALILMGIAIVPQGLVSLQNHYIRTEEDRLMILLKEAESTSILKEMASYTLFATDRLPLLPDLEGRADRWYLVWHDQTSPTIVIGINDGLVSYRKVVVYVASEEYSDYQSEILYDRPWP